MKSRNSSPPPSPLLAIPEEFFQHSPWVLFLGNIDPQYSLYSKLTPLLRDFGHIVQMITMTAPSGMLFAAVAYQDPNALVHAKAYLNGRRLGFSRVYAAARILPFVLPPTATNRPNQLYIRNFGECIAVQVLHAVARPYGHISRLKLTRSVHGYRFAVMTFHTTLDRDRTLHSLEGHDLGDGYRLMVTLPPPDQMPDHGPVSPVEFRALQLARSYCYVRVSNLPPLTASDEIALFIMFAYHGHPVEFSVLRGCDGQQLGHITVRYALWEEGRQAVDKRNGEIFAGRRLKVEIVWPSALPIAYEV